MKVTLLPAQIVVEEAVILTEGVNKEFTVMVIVLDVAGEFVTQVAFEVISQETLSPFVSEEFEYAALLVPTLFPLSIH